MLVNETCATLARIFRGDSDEQAGFERHFRCAIYAGFLRGFRAGADGE
jgi:hypothetical protein